MSSVVAPTQRKALIPADAVQKVLAFGALIMLFVVFTASSPNFLQFDNVVGILLSTAVNGVLALGVTFIIITGGIDLSVGTVMTLSAVMTGVLVTYWHVPLPLGILGGILTGAFMGFLNGVI
ncbi:MAG: ABC transporter permease, partial [Chloroflexia bacterium]